MKVGNTTYLNIQFDSRFTCIDDPGVHLGVHLNSGELIDLLTAQAKEKSPNAAMESKYEIPTGIVNTESVVGSSAESMNANLDANTSVPQEVEMKSEHDILNTIASEEEDKGKQYKSLSLSI